MAHNQVNDNRGSCGSLLPSGCVPYTGYVSPSITELACRPNVNDILKEIQDLIDGIKLQLGDISALDPICLVSSPVDVTQADINQLIIDQLCVLKAQVANLNTTVDPRTLQIAINLLCLTTNNCPPQTTYSLQTILENLISAYCNLLTRVQNIESILNI